LVVLRAKSANKRQRKDLNRTEKKTEKLKKKVVVTTAAALGMALLFLRKVLEQPL
jgi:hypothetical protein